MHHFVIELVSHQRLPETLGRFGRAAARRPGPGGSSGLHHRDENDYIIKVWGITFSETSKMHVLVCLRSFPENDMTFDA
jgi:hypothetical protein